MATLRQLCKETNKRSSKALFYFAEERMTGIAPTRLIIGSGKDTLDEGSIVTVNWQGKKVQAEILALSDDEVVLSTRDLEWCRKNLPDALESLESPTDITNDLEEPPRKKAKSAIRQENKESSSTADPSIAQNPYTAFLAEQRQREMKWASDREANRRKDKLNDQAAENSSLKEKLLAKNKECDLLKNQLEDVRRQNNTMAMENRNEALSKVMEKVEDSIGALDDKMSMMMSRMEQRLETLEKMMSEMVNGSPRHIRQTIIATEQCDLPDDLATIDVEAFAKLTDGDATLLGGPATPGTSLPVSTTSTTPLAASVTPATSIAASVITPATSLAASVTPATPFATDLSDVLVGEEIIRTCVTPSKVKEVQKILNTEKQRHLCALKLLNSFFTRQELSTSNTDGTHGKQSLDRNKLNSLKALVFAKFPVEPSEEKEKIWRAVKGKINTKCHVSKLSFTRTN